MVEDFLESGGGSACVGWVLLFVIVKGGWMLTFF